MPEESITFSVDLQSAVDWLESACPKSLGFGISLGLNTLALAIQDRIRQGIIDRFTLRRKAWILNRVFIAREDKATKTSWSTTISINEPREILSKFEEGGEHVPFQGHAHMAIPNKNVFKSIIRADDPLTIKNLKIKETSPNHLQGLYGSFIIRDKNTGTPLVMQDMVSLSSGYFGPLSQAHTKKVMRGLGKKDPRQGNRILYTLVKRSTLKPTLQFVETASQVINSQMDQIMSIAIETAIRTSR